MKDYLVRSYEFTLEQMKMIELLQSRYALSDSEVIKRCVALCCDVSSALGKESLGQNIQAKLEEYFIDLEDSSSLSLSSKRN